MSVFRNILSLPGAHTGAIWRKREQNYHCELNINLVYPEHVVENNPNFFEKELEPQFTATAMVRFAKFCVDCKMKDVGAEQLEQFLKL